MGIIRDHIAACLCAARRQANLGIEPDDFECAPFSQQGGLGKVCLRAECRQVHQLFGPDLTPIMENLNTALVA